RWVLRRLDYGAGLLLCPRLGALLGERLCPEECQQQCQQQRLCTGYSPTASDRNIVHAVPPVFVWCLPALRGAMPVPKVVRPFERSAGSLATLPSTAATGYRRPHRLDSSANPVAPRRLLHRGVLPGFLRH